ncbi:MAG TPA: hypothetical protein VN836_01305 [Verrucomicrobiae bacterium]|nr:hypothetical protein [Verrucomicrobiae bacterium]
MPTKGNEGSELPLFVFLVCFCSKKVRMGGKIGRAPIRKSLGGGLRQRSRFRAGLRVLKVKSYGDHWYLAAAEFKK